MPIHYERQVHPNGLRVITAPIKDTKAVTILIMVGAGSRYEDERTNGVAHFLEHMFFKGTTNRPSTLELTKELDAMGADYNAFTGEEYTGFYVRCASEDFAQAFDIITDMLLNPLFVDEEIEREKGVIIEELNMYEDTPMRAIYDYAKGFMYGDTPLGRNIGGKKETVTKFTRQDFLDFRKRHYQPDNLLVVVAGGGSETAWKEAVSERLGSLEGKAETDFVKAKPAKESSPVRLVTKKTDQTQLMIGFPSFPRTDDQRPVLNVLENIFGDTMSSRLFIEVRERRGLAYSIRAGAFEFRDTGAFFARGGLKLEKIDEALKVILEEFHRLRAAPVSEEELERAQKNLRGSLYLGMEDSQAIAQYLAEEELFENRIRQPEDLIEAWHAVTREQLQMLATKIVDPAQAYITLIGPYEDPKRFEKIVADWAKAS
jgi:predicted Zn-dependent peptidase